jgi:predicted enzyme related to lactoylglutathione lyase
MSKGIETVIYPTSDVERTKSLLRIVLGTEPYVDAPFYVGFRVEGSEIGIDPNGHSQGMTGPVPYTEVADIAATYESLIRAGAEAVQKPRDVGQGKMVAAVKDGDGNMIGIMHTP